MANDLFVVSCRLNADSHRTIKDTHPQTGVGAKLARAVKP